MSDDDIFSRWSRRKRAAAREEVEEAPVEDTPSAPEPVPADDSEDEAALLERLGLPVPETMVKGDDFSAFMAPGVPGFLRKRALRVLWGSNPVLANLDGLNDYDDDFTSPELTKRIVATGYQVGRGFIRDILEGSGENETAADEVAEAQEYEASADFAVEERVVSSEILSNEPREEAPSTETEARPRRMRFET